MQEERQISHLLSGGNVPAELSLLQKSYDKTGLREACVAAFSAFIIIAGAVLAHPIPCACARDTTDESGYCFKCTYLAATPD